VSNSISGLINQSFQRFSSNIAIIQHHPNGESASFSYKDLKVMAGKIYGLFGESLPGDECIGLYMQRSVEHVAAVVASLYSKSPYTAINQLVSARQVSYIAKSSNMKVLICDNSTLLKLRTLTDDDVNKEILSNLRIVHIHSGDVLQTVYAKTVEYLSKFISIKSVTLAKLKPYDLTVPTTNLVNTAKLILFTSGSTGTPKGVMINGDDLIRRVESESKAYDLREEDVLLNILPFSFDVGCNQLYCALANGCSLAILNSWMPKDIISAIIDYKVTGVSGVPSLWLSIVNSNLKPLKEASRTLRYITISGGDMAEKDRLALRDLLPKVRIFKTYGQTETFRSVMLLADHFDTKQRSVGKPVEGVKLYILDDEGNLVKPGEVGEIIHQGVGTMLGYIGDADTTNKKLKVLPDVAGSADEKVIFTGDLGRLDEDGFLYLHGRKDRMFKVRGNRIYPEEIEKELCSHQDILEAVCSYNSSKELITVFVRQKQGSYMDQNEVIKYLSSRLPSYMIPGRCLLYYDFPRTASGKVDVPTLTFEDS